MTTSGTPGKIRLVMRRELILHIPLCMDSILSIYYYLLYFQFLILKHKISHYNVICDRNEIK